MAAVGRTGLELAGLNDFLWLGLLDIPAALTARRSAIDGELVLDVRDDAPGTSIDVSGRYALAITELTIGALTRAQLMFSTRLTPWNATSF